MNWYTLKREFMVKYPDWKIVVNPPCISGSRYTHYVHEVYAYVLGKKSDVAHCTIETDEVTKTFTLYRNGIVRFAR